MDLIKKDGLIHSLQVEDGQKKEVIEGTYQDAYAYFLWSKKIQEKTCSNFTAFGSPTYRGITGPNTQSVYDLAGRKLQLFWGWQDGEKEILELETFSEPVSKWHTLGKWKII